MMKYGFIGLGNMGGAIVKGMLKTDAFQNDEVFGFDTDLNKAEKLREDCGIALKESTADTVRAADVVVLAVKPQFMQSVIDKCRKESTEGKLFVSIAAGLPTSYYERELSQGVRVVRAMPNLNAAYNAAIVGLCKGAYASDADLETAENIFRSVGSTVRIAEDKFAAFSAVAGASPAFVFMFADALAMAAVKAGIPRDTAVKIASEAVRGSGFALCESGIHPDVLRDMVCSPGGTTIEGVTVLERNGFKGLMIDAVDAVIAKDKKLSG